MADAYKLNGSKWQNRIVGYGNVPPDQLLANPFNFRRHPKYQQDALAGVLGEVGWVQDVVVNVTTDHLLDGHLRVMLALRNGEPTVPVKYVKLTEAEERLILATLDPIGAMAQIDAAALDTLLASVNTGDAAVQKMLAGLAEDAGLYSDETEAVDAEPQIDRAEELRQKWQVETGQLWQLGDHRLICGDCTDAEVVARVMGGEKAVYFVTDPPYTMQASSDKAKKADPDDQGLLFFLRAAWETCLPHIKTTAGAVWFGNWQTVPIVKRAVWQRSAINFQAAVWHKGSGATPGSPWMNCFEMLLFYGLEDWAKGGPFSTGLSNVQTIDWQGGTRENHPAEKPVDIYRFALSAIRDGGVVLDPFSGSGTTIIACEQLGRKCRAIEISAGYVAVALQRWADAAGREPVRVE